MEKIKFSVEYRKQSENLSFNYNKPGYKGKFTGWVQCMTTVAWILMSYYTDKVKVNSKEDLAKYLDSVETEIGKPGIGEWVKKTYTYVTGNSSKWWITQKHGIDKWLKERDVPGEAIFLNKTKKISAIPELLKKFGPIMIGTKKMGGLPDGHIILIIGYCKDTDGEVFICHDTAGNAMYNYKKGSGENVIYPVSFLSKYTGEYFYGLYWKGE